MGLRLQRHLGGVESLQPGQWTDHTATGMPCLCCPCCAALTDLVLDHTIDEDGRVAPAWKCPTDTCAFFEFVHLESFGEDVLA